MVKKLIYISSAIGVLILLIYALQSLQKKTGHPSSDTVIVYTYNSFASSWGVGPRLKELFHKSTGKSVEFYSVGEAGTVIQRLELEGEFRSVDVVLGLDHFSLEDARKNLAWLSLEELNKNIKWDPHFPRAENPPLEFTPFNWAPMTFLYNKKEGKPFETLEELAQYPKSFSLLDPRTSTPGYIFFYWILQQKGEEGARKFFSDIKGSIVSVSPSWSAGYGLFKSNQAKYVFSHISSALYHWIEEKDQNFQPIFLKSPLPYHTEYVGILKGCKNCEGAQEFIEFLLSPIAQEVLLKGNYMFPVVADVPMSQDQKNLKSVELLKLDEKFSKREVLRIWKSLGL